MSGRGRAWLRVAAASLGAAAIAIGAAGLQVDDAGARPLPAESATSALWSARRVPFVYVDEVARIRLRQAAEHVAAEHDACIAIGDADPVETLVRVRADVPLTPASTTKLLTAVAALAVLGPEHTFVTRALADGGRLHLVGGGDPVLSTAEHATRLHTSARRNGAIVTPLDALADAIVAAGVSQLDAIVADDSRHEAVRFLPGWKASYRADVGALSALTVDGGFAGTTRVDDPALLAAERLRALLVARGVTVGSAGRGTAPSAAREVASVVSPPLRDIVAEMVSASDNLAAEMLTRELGIARGGDGSTAAGTHAIVATLAELGVPTAGLDLRDGSGLDPANALTCDAILAALRLGTAGDRFSAVDAGLAVAGRTGTLSTRLRGDALDGVLRAKTGQIAGVAGLAGVVDDAEALRFAYVVNGAFSTAGGQALQVDAARVVAAYPDAPAPDELVPAP